MFLADKPPARKFSRTSPWNSHRGLEKPWIFEAENRSSLSSSLNSIWKSVISGFYIFSDFLPHFRSNNVFSTVFFVQRFVRVPRGTATLASGAPSRFVECTVDVLSRSRQRVSPCKARAPFRNPFQRAAAPVWLPAGQAPANLARYRESSASFVFHPLLISPPPRPPTSGRFSASWNYPRPHSAAPPPTAAAAAASSPHKFPATRDPSSRCSLNLAALYSLGRLARNGGLCIIN